VHTGSDELAWTRVAQPGQPSQPGQAGGLGYLLATDEQLVAERQRQRLQLRLLTVNPGTSPAIGTVFASIERAIERIDDELIRRVTTRSQWSTVSST
jgi:hypothetical protein